ncbi:Hypothetical protein SMAX5B_013828 [Scophthalmus maximus]|uniref:Uncharacterized protein n=1 Tax=Scophthalmus maximus TaxID=52904 RepID=A0A2U9CLF6_SCOMX|nr:Hypothetical protein SMAX5B_013828 [Scophthalmus maximus]
MGQLSGGCYLSFAALVLLGPLVPATLARAAGLLSELADGRGGLLKSSAHVTCATLMGLSLRLRCFDTCVVDKGRRLSDKWIHKSKCFCGACPTGINTTPTVPYKPTAFPHGAFRELIGLSKC